MAAIHKQLSEKGLPASEHDEQLVLGVVLVDDCHWQEVADLPSDIFTTESRRRVFSAMRDLAARGDGIDHTTVSSELLRKGHLESCGGLQGILALTDGIPNIPHLTTNIKTLRSCYQRRQVLFTAQKVFNDCLIGEVDVEQALAPLDKLNQEIQWGQKGKDKGRNPTEIVSAVKGGIVGFLEPSTQPKGIQTGLMAFDDATGGLFGDQLIVIGGRPAMGKTGLCGSITENVTVDGKHVSIFSLEMNGASLLRRMMCANARMDLHKFKHGNLTAEDRLRLREALHQLMERPLTIHDTPNMAVEEICSQAEKDVKYFGTKLVIIDHLGLVSTRQRFGTKDLEVGHITYSLKMLSKKLDVPVILLSQLSRMTEKAGGSARPELRDLRNSGNIEQDADIVAFIYRDEYYHRDKPEAKGRAELIFKKVRDGPTGTAHMRFIHQYVKFENLPDGEVHWTD